MNSKAAVGRLEGNFVNALFCDNVISIYVKPRMSVQGKLWKKFVKWEVEAITQRKGGHMFVTEAFSSEFLGWI